MTIEDQGGAGGDLDRHGVLLVVVESVRLPGAVEAGVALFPLRVEHAGAV